MGKPVLISIISLFIFTGFFRFNSGLQLQLHPALNFVEKFVGSNFDIICNGTSFNKTVNWFDEKGDPINKKMTNVHSHPFRNKGDEAVLSFNNITKENEGNYTCALPAKIIEEISFYLSVVEQTKFKIPLATMYAEEGNPVVLTCDYTSDKRAIATWYVNGQKVEGNDYKVVDEHNLSIENVSSEHFGEYTCRVYLTTDHISSFNESTIILKKAERPLISTTEKENTVCGILNATVEIECKVTAEPPANIIWLKDGINVLSSNNTEVIQRVTGSTLKIKQLDESQLGQYTCNASNNYGSSSETFLLKEAIIKVSIRDIYENYIQLDIFVYENRTLSKFQFQYVKDDGNISSFDFDKWTTINLQIKPSQTEPYSINELEAESKYLYRVGSCDTIICKYTEVHTFTTAKRYVSAANPLTFGLLYAIIIPAVFCVNYK